MAATSDKLRLHGEGTLAVAASEFLAQLLRRLSACWHARLHNACLWKARGGARRDGVVRSQSIPVPLLRVQALGASCAYCPRQLYLHL
eukprot:6186512-Pleurochrysis_carterae.AAC.5